MTLPPTTQRRVLIDNTASVKLQINEATDGSKRLYAEGKIGHAGTATANGRVYPLPIVGRELTRLQPRIEQASLYAAVDHPGDGKSRIMNAGAIIRGLRVEQDGTIWGKFEIVEETDCGRNLAALLRRGGAVGVSSRGLGSTSTNESGHEVVGEDFRLVSFDFVLDPAVQTAYPQFFSESEEQLSKVTVDALRAKFPHLVKAIEESANHVASSTTVEAIRADVEADVERALVASKDQLREQFKSELYPEVVREIKEDFGVKLIRATADIRKEVESVVRSELAADPSVAGAKMALEAIANIVSPFKPPADVKKVIDERDAAIVELKKTLSSLEKEIDKVRSESQTNANQARQLGFRLFVEKKLAGRTDSESIREMIGDVKAIATVEALQQKVEAAIQSADKALEEATNRVKQEMEAESRVSSKKAELAAKRAELAESANEATRSKLVELTERVDSALSAKNAQIAEQAELIDQLERKLEKAARIAEQLDTKAFATTRLVGHPKRSEILREIETGSLRGRKAVSAVAETNDINADAMNASERVRHFFGKGREHMPEEQRRQKEITEQRQTRTPVPNLEDLDLSMEEIRKLARAGEPPKARGGR